MLYFDEEKALSAAGQIARCGLFDVTDRIALSAAEDSIRYRLAMADALIYATARLNKCRILTLDKHFKGLPLVIKM